MAKASKIKWLDAIADVVGERTRQILDEGWTPEHDDYTNHRQPAKA